jgi:predicted nucleic acid-binding protein
MTVAVFVDTNIWLYARDPADARKHAVARQLLDRLWEERTGRTSLQVLNEYYVNVTHVVSRPLNREEAWEDVQAMLVWNPQPVDPDVMQHAHELERKYRLGWWDCLIAGAAQVQGCSILVTEDLQHGMLLAGLRVINPFADAVSETVLTPRLPPRRSRRSRMAA